MIKNPSILEGFFYLQYFHFGKNLFYSLIVSVLRVSLLFWYIDWHSPVKTNHIMLTIALLLALLLMVWVFYKSIDWFEKI